MLQLTPHCIVITGDPFPIIYALLSICEWVYPIGQGLIAG